MKNKLILLCGLLICSCSIIENTRPEKEFYLSIPNNLKYSVEVEYGGIDTKWIDDSLTTYLICLKRLPGGSAYLFGLIKLYEINANDEKNIIIKNYNGLIVRKLSPNEIYSFRYSICESSEIYKY